MLRNWIRSITDWTLPTVLNEVLSLNAQEFPHAQGKLGLRGVLNEVLSLNAQE